MECEEEKSEEMTREEKEQFCSLAAALLVQPDAALVDDLLQEGLRPRLEAYIHQWGDNSILLSALFPEEDDKITLSRLCSRSTDGSSSIRRAKGFPW